MKYSSALAVVALAGSFGLGAASPQSQPQGSAPAATDVYHVHFTKAVPGQAAELGTALSTPNPKAPMSDHFVVLRHQEGDDWDYVVIQHMGQKVTLDPAQAGPTPGANLRAWHNDTFALGPAWPEFTKAMGIGGVPGGVYTVSVHRHVAGRRAELLKALTASPPGKVQTGDVLLQHMEGGDWAFLNITRYNSWQDFAADRVEAAAASGPGSWADVRQYSAFHRDTIADRVFPK